MPTRSLGVLMPPIPAQRWSCRGCARCCYDLVGHLTDAERRRIDDHGWAARLGAAPYVRLGRAWVLNKHDDGACVFLDRDTRHCRIHDELGYDAKPLACRVYPFTLRDTPDGWRAALRFDCPSVADSHGEPIPSFGRALREMALEAGRRPEPPPDLPLLADRLRATEHETDLVINRFVAWMLDRRRDLAARLAGAAGVAALLVQADFEHVRGARLAELLDMLFTAAEPSVAELPPTPRQDALLRQWAFVHAERIPLARLRAGPLARLAHRVDQWRRSSAFRRGRGQVPSPYISTSVSFEDVARVRPAADPAGLRRIDDLLVRFVAARLSARMAFGPDYFNWPVMPGIAALFGSLAVVGWLARLRAAAAGRIELTFDDCFEGLRAVDQSAGRAPLLGSPADRLRVEYLARDNGLARLLARWSPTAAATADPAGR